MFGQSDQVVVYYLVDVGWVGSVGNFVRLFGFYRKWWYLRDGQYEKVVGFEEVQCVLEESSFFGLCCNDVCSGECQIVFDVLLYCFFYFVGVLFVVGVYVIGKGCGVECLKEFLFIVQVGVCFFDDVVQVFEYVECWLQCFEYFGFNWKLFEIWVLGDVCIVQIDVECLQEF